MTVSYPVSPAEFPVRRAREMMQPLFDRGMPVTDADGKQLKKGQTVTDCLFGDGIVKITGQITKSTPRLFTKFNYRITWADKTKGPSKLGVENYAHGADACYNSWVILTPS